MENLNHTFKTSKNLEQNCLSQKVTLLKIIATLNYSHALGFGDIRRFYRGVLCVSNISRRAVIKI